MSDDLDLDLDAFDPEKHPRKPRSEAAASAAQPAAEADAKPAAKAVAARLPGLASRVGASVSAPLSAVREHRWDLKTFLWGLLGLILLVLLIENWVPMRFYFLGLRFELPRALAFIVDMAIGGLILWLWLRRKSHAGESES